MTKRLVELVDENIPYCVHEDWMDCEITECYDCPRFDEIRIKLAHYEDLEEQGRLVELPAENNFKRDELDRCIHRHCNKCDGYRKEIQRYKELEQQGNLHIVPKPFWDKIMEHLIKMECPCEHGLKGFNEDDCKVDDGRCRLCWELALKVGEEE